MGIECRCWKILAQAKSKTVHWPSVAGDSLVVVQDILDLKVSDVRRNKKVLVACFVWSPSRTPRMAELSAAVEKLMTEHNLFLEEVHQSVAMLIVTSAQLLTCISSLACVHL